MLHLANNSGSGEPDPVIWEGRARLAHGGGSVPREAHVASRAARPPRSAGWGGVRVGDTEWAAEPGPARAATVPRRARPAAVIALSIRVVPYPARRR
jgi:hypothetical protein